MVINNVYEPYINPIKLVIQDFVISDKYHLRHFDEVLFADQRYDFQEEKKYYQQYQTNDPIYFQLVSDFGVPQVRLINCSEEIIVTGTTTPIANTFYKVPEIAYGLNIDLTTVPTGYYFVKVIVGSGASETTLISEPLYIDTDIPNSVLFEYTHKKNFYGAIFQNKETFAFRCHATFAEFQPGVNEIVFEDQPANVVRLSSTPFRSFKLIIGDGYGVPDWVADKINRIFGMDKIWLDGKQFVRAEGSKMDRNGDRLYPMAGWTLEVREAQAKNGLTISNNMPTNYEVVSSIIEQTEIFGDTAELVTDAIIIEKT